MGIHVVKNAVGNSRLVPINDTMSHIDLFRAEIGAGRIVAALCGMTPGEPRKMSYHETEFSIILEGEIHAVDDEKADEVVKLTRGDVVKFDHGASVTFTAVNHAKAFYVTRTN